MFPRDAAAAGKDFAHACELGLTNGCAGLLRLVRGKRRELFPECLRSGRRRELLPLGSLYYAGKASPKILPAPSLCFGQSCTAGWWRGCGGLAECYRAGAGTAVDNARAIEEFDKACQGGVASSCFSASQCTAV